MGGAGDDGGGRRADRYRQHVGLARQGQLRGLCADQAAKRILAETIAREMGPKGVHVAYLVIDAVIDVPWAREAFKEARDDFFIQPAAIAAEALHLRTSR